MKGWQKIRLGDVCTMNADSYSSKEAWKFINYLDTGNITDDKIDLIQFIDIKKDKLPSRARRKVKKDSIIFSTVRPNQRHFGIIKNQPDNFLVSTGFVVIDVNTDVLDADFLYYLLSQNAIVETLQTIAEQSTTSYPSITATDIENLELQIPSIAEQKKISKTLRCLDLQIKHDKKVNDNLEKQAKLIYEFMMQEAKNGNITGKFTTSGDLTEVMTGKEDANFSEINGKYKFFTCSIEPLKCNKYVFDKSAILIAGNGDFNVKHYTGKFNAYQRTYVLSPLSEYYGLLYLACLYRINTFKSASSGSIVKFITKSDIENIPIFIPNDATFLIQLNKILSLQEKNSAETEKLISLRDWLLPMLMNGQATISD